MIMDKFVISNGIYNYYILIWNLSNWATYEHE